MCSQDIQQGLCTTMVAAVATFCVCMKIHSGKPTLTDIRLGLHRSAAWNMNCFTITTSSQKSTTEVVHLLKILRHVQSATCLIGQQSSWFQQERSVRTGGLQSTVDIWPRTIPRQTTTENAAATSVWTRHRKLQSVAYHKIMRRSSLPKCIAERCHAQCTSTEESWPASFVLSDKSWTLDTEWTLLGKVRGHLYIVTFDFTVSPLFVRHDYAYSAHVQQRCGWFCDAFYAYRTWINCVICVTTILWQVILLLSKNLYTLCPRKK